MAVKQSAGARLSADLDGALVRAGKEIGRTLEWSEQEVQVIGLAARTADRAEILRCLFDAERAGDASPMILVRLSAELRLLDRQVVDLVGRVRVGVGPAKSVRHQRAARRRWDMKHQLDA